LIPVILRTNFPIRRDTDRLEVVGLLGHRDRDGRRSHTYFFVFHSSFEQTSTSAQSRAGEKLERTPDKVLTGHRRPVDGDLSGQPRPTNQKGFNQQLESPQHHRVKTGDHENADDVAASPAFVRAIEAEVGSKLSRGDLKYCAELERRGLDAETVCAGVVVGRIRKLFSNTNCGISDPIRSLRYFRGCMMTKRLWTRSSGLGFEAIRCKG
jgi:hypothetical protein